MGNDKVAILFTGLIALFFVVAFLVAFREPLSQAWRQRRGRKKERPKTGDFFL